MLARLDCDYGYGEWGNPAKVLRMKEKSYEEQKVYVKNLWQQDPEKYYEWKETSVMRSNLLPEFFGPRDNPIPIDRSKLYELFFLLVYNTIFISSLFSLNRIISK